MRRTVLALAMVFSMMLAGCFGDGSETITNEVSPSIFESYERIDMQPHEVERSSSPLICARTRPPTPRGLCLTPPTAATAASTIWRPTSTVKSSTSVANTRSFHRPRPPLGHLHPPALPDQQCRTFVPTNPGQEGLGEGSIVQATNGDIISMSWFPYVGGDLKLDKFYAILYDESEGEWKWCYNRIRSRSTTARGKSRSSAPSVPPSATASGRACGVQLLAPNAKCRWTNQR